MSLYSAFHLSRGSGLWRIRWPSIAAMVAGTFLCCIGFAASARGQPRVVSVEVSDAVINTSGWVEFTLRNRTAQPVTGWEIRVTLRHPDGFVGGKVSTRDGYLEFEGLGAAQAARVLVPGRGEIRTKLSLIRYPAHPPPVSLPELTVEGGVFLDGSGFGDTESRRHILQAREEAFDAWAAVISVLDTAASELPDTTASMLGAIDKALSKEEEAGKLPSGGMARTTVMEMRRAMENTLNRDQKRSARQVLSDELAFARKQFAAVERHRWPKR